MPRGRSHAELILVRGRRGGRKAATGQVRRAAHRAAGPAATRPLPHSPRGLSRDFLRDFASPRAIVRRLVAIGDCVLAWVARTSRGRSHSELILVRGRRGGRKAATGTSAVPRVARLECTRIGIQAKLSTTALVFRVRVHSRARPQAGPPRTCRDVTLPHWSARRLRRFPSATLRLCVRPSVDTFVFCVTFVASAWVETLPPDQPSAPTSLASVAEATAAGRSHRIHQEIYGSPP